MDGICLGVFFVMIILACAKWPGLIKALVALFVITGRGDDY